jgi:hypothetical protein
VAWHSRAQLPASSGSLLIAVPGLIAGAVTGFSGGRAATHFAGLLRLCTVIIALLAVLGGIVVAVHGTEGADLRTRHDALLVLMGLAAALTLVPAYAFWRPRAKDSKLLGARRDDDVVTQGTAGLPIAPIEDLAGYLAKWPG